MSGRADLDYVGFLEGDDIGAGKVDVGHRRFCRRHCAQDRQGTPARSAAIAAAIQSSSSRIGYLFARSTFDSCANGCDPRRADGGVFLGLDGIVDQEPRRRRCRGSPPPSSSATRWCATSCWLGRGGAWTGRGRRAATGADRSRFVTVRRSVVLRCAATCRTRSWPMPIWRAKSTTSDESIVQRTGFTAAHRRSRRIHLAYGCACSPCSARARPSRCAGHRPDRAGHLDADDTFPAARSRSRARSASPMVPPSTCRRLLLQLRFMRCRSPNRLLKSRRYRPCAGGRRRNLAPDPGLHRPAPACVLFSDGAGAVVLEARDRPGTVTPPRATVRLRYRRPTKSKLYVDGGPSSTGPWGVCDGRPRIFAARWR